MGNDLREGIMTLPMLLARKNDSDGLLKLALVNSDGNTIKAAIAFMIESGAVTQAKSVARNYLDTALSSVAAMDNNRVKSELLSIGEFVINRYS